MQQWHWLIACLMINEYLFSKYHINLQSCWSKCGSIWVRNCNLNANGLCRSDIIIQQTVSYLLTMGWLCSKENTNIPNTGIIWCMRPANERQRYTVTLSLIGWAHTRNNPCKHQWKIPGNISHTNTQRNFTHTLRSQWINSMTPNDP